MNSKNPVRRILDSIFLRLLKRGQISTYQFVKASYNSIDQTYTLSYTALISKTNSYRVFLSFEIRFTDLQASIVKETTSRQLLFSLSYISLADNTKEVCLAIEDQLKKWRRGEQHERFFQTRFLKPLQEKYPKMIHSVIKSSDKDDRDFGIDFTVVFEGHKPQDIKEVNFNIKSSAAFLKKHRSKYPTISVFLFTKDDLKDMKRLEKRFLSFIFSAQYKTVAF